MKSRVPSLAALIALFALTASAAWAGNAKVQVCHIPPGNPANFHTITISENALQPTWATATSRGRASRTATPCAATATPVRSTPAMPPSTA